MSNASLSGTWDGHVLLLLGSGVVASAQVGKAIISVPLIRADLMLGLDLAGLIVALFATLGATMGIGAAVVVGRLGIRRALIGGMSVVAVGNVIGASAPDEFVLLAARIIEDIGFMGVVLAIPQSRWNRLAPSSVSTNDGRVALAVFAAAGRVPGATPA